MNATNNFFDIEPCRFILYVNNRKSQTRWDMVVIYGTWQRRWNTTSQSFLLGFLCQWSSVTEVNDGGFVEHLITSLWDVLKLSFTLVVLCSCIQSLNQFLDPGVLWICTDFLLLRLLMSLLHHKPTQIGSQSLSVSVNCGKFQHKHESLKFPNSHNSAEVAIPVCFLHSVTFNVFQRIFSHPFNVAEAAVAISAWRQRERGRGREVSTIYSQRAGLS